eukprot:TRINITY_DN2031_c0_g1_i2.p1 TRINITY_DN2031_c0_g1~~TRINITY_DN2031_c0_g1_i2.p1  ORF type:complete len:354 (-),score=-19.10 TRINITY_DN2031_c0_g1_i2:188-1249(-)
MSVAGDTCATMPINYGVSADTFASLNPALDCSAPLPLNTYVCVASKTAAQVTSTNCSTWYRVMQGDTCPTIWNGANLTMSQFLAINPGILCQAPFLVVGQQVCVDSPQLASMRLPNTTYYKYTVKAGDTLPIISAVYINRCTPNSVAPDSIAAQNNIANLTAPLTAGLSLLIPCVGRAGVLDCGCAPSLDVCGADYVTYPSYCDALCNFAMPVLAETPCAGCQLACAGRAGFAPRTGYGCTWGVCPYPKWSPQSADCSAMVGDVVGKCCTFEQTTCDNVCTMTMQNMGGTAAQQTKNYNDCYNQCMCCTRIPCQNTTCLAPSSCVFQSPRKCVYSGGMYLWNCAYFPVANPLP